MNPFDQWCKCNCVAGRELRAKAKRLRELADWLREDQCGTPCIVGRGCMMCEISRNLRAYARALTAKK